MGRGRVVPNVSLGGPIVEAFGTRVPIPYLTTGLDYGLSNRANLNANAHLLALAYGIVGWDAGFTWFPVGGPGATTNISLAPRVLVFASMRGGVTDRFRVYPALSATGARRVWGGLLYAGTDVAIPLSTLDYDPEGASAIWSPFAGYRWNLGGLYLLTELKWQGLNLRGDQLAVGYVHPGGRGALAPLVALQKRF